MTEPDRIHGFRQPQSGGKRLHSSYGWSARLGLIVPTTNTVNEAEWQLLLATCQGISLHVARMDLHLDHSTQPDGQLLHANLKTALGQLTPASLDAIAYGCTAGSMISPLDALSDAMEGEAGVPCATTAASLVHAARHLGLQKVAVATPYAENLNAHEQTYLHEHGLDVLSIRGLGLGAGGVHELRGIARVPEEEVYAHALASWHPEADGMIISCTDFPTLRVLPALEARLGKPVISSNAATLWRMLELSGLTHRFEGYGQLLQAQSGESGK